MSSTNRGLGGAVKRSILKLHPRANAVSQDEEDPKICDLTDNKPYLNRKTDSEVLIGVSLFEDTISDDEGEFLDETDNSREDHDIEAGMGHPNADSDFWSKRIEGGERKGFDRKAKIAAVPTVASIERMARRRQSKMGRHPGGSDIMADQKSYVSRKLLTMLSPTDNRLSMKLFGSRKGIQKEQRRLKDAGNLIIHPCSMFR